MIIAQYPARNSRDNTSNQQANNVATRDKNE